MTAIQQIHQSALAIYRAYREEHPEFTFALRTRGDRLEKGYYFQGDDSYVWTSPYQPHDSTNRTRRFGFVIYEDGECKATIALNDGNDDIAAYSSFYDKANKIINDKLGSSDEKPWRQDDIWCFSDVINQQKLPLEETWQQKLWYFLNVIVPLINQAAEGENVPDSYLFVPPEKFAESMKKVEEVEKRLNSGIINADEKPPTAAERRQAFDKWLENTKTQYGNPFNKEYRKALCDALEFKYDDAHQLGNLFEIVDIHKIKEYHDNCNKGGVWYEWGESVSHSRTSLSRYLKFLKQQPNEGNDTTQENNPMAINSKPPLNQIFYGPPGTGKTFNTVNKALEILGAEPNSVKSIAALKDAFPNQVEFVTFHQNFTYEDFIEGIKPMLDNEEGSSENIQYEIAPGVFKVIAERAKENLNLANSLASKKQGEHVDVEALLQDYADDVDEKLSNGEEVSIYKTDKTDRKIIRVNYAEDVFKSFNLSPAYNRLGPNREIIIRDFDKFLSGDIAKHQDIKPSRPSKKSRHSKSRIYFGLYGKLREFYEKNKEAYTIDVNMPLKSYVLIIDEINRGNIAKIFGELITLLEDTKRSGRDEAISVVLPYSKESFTVPNNLYIIGTMNTADRSIALLDTALRRRFHFVEMMPQHDLKEISNDVEGVDCRALLRAMNERITVLLDREHQIGHSYFMGVDSLPKLKDRFQNNIIPLLQEYFYGQWDNINSVLNGNGFVKDITDELLMSKGLLRDEQRVYALCGDDSVWDSVEAYQKIYDGEDA